MSKIVIALGGNALGKTPKEQLELVKKTAKHIIDLVEEGNEVIVTHGNGPQVGMINLAFETAREMPCIGFAECGAMSQGYIGYHLQQALQIELNKRNISKPCVSVITEVEVLKDDPAFNNPTKPIGSFYTKEEALKLAEENDWKIKEDANRGYRRVIASPKPIKIVELPAIKELIKQGCLTIACGGGGIPVLKDENGYEGIDAVIDKDKTSALLAKEIDADILLILTAVDKVYINFGKEQESAIDEMTVGDALKYIEEGQFAKGSMLPKIEACLDFVSSTDKKAIIASLENAKNALNGNSGTIIKE